MSTTTESVTNGAGTLEHAIPNTFKVTDLFELSDAGVKLTCLEKFNYSDVRGSDFTLRIRMLRAISNAPVVQLAELPEQVRRVLFWFIKREAGRYYGNAVKKDGSAYQKLTFATPGQAVAYRDAIRLAQGQLKEAVQRVTGVVSGAPAATAAATTPTTFGEAVAAVQAMPTEPEPHGDDMPDLPTG